MSGSYTFRNVRFSTRGHGLPKHRWATFPRVILRRLVASGAPFFGGAALVLFGIHLVTVATNIQFAFMTNPEIAATLHHGKFFSSIIFSYRQFYLEYGMYLFVLALWSPYLIVVISRSGTVVRRTDHGPRTPQTSR